MPSRPENPLRSGSSQAAPDPDAVSSDAARAQLERILGSEAFRHAERLSRFVRYVVEQRIAGNGDQLKESVLAVEIFDRDTTYDPRNESVVRVEARRVRDRLTKYYENEGREDPVIITLPKGSYAPILTYKETRESVAAVVPVPEAPPAARSALPIKILVPVAAMSLVVLVIFVKLSGVFGSEPAQPSRRLTADPGLTFQPALSADGKLLAYSSDRGGSGQLDIWIQQTASARAPVRLTMTPGDHLTPDFSPDGSMVAYRTEGETDGVYLVPTLGGSSTLLARGGYRPRFSPDGRKIAYWTGERAYRTAETFVMPTSGGASTRVQPDLPYVAYPVWSPDGKFILFVGAQQQAGESESEEWDWWVSPVHGGAPERTGARKALDLQKLQPPRKSWSHRRIVPYAWTSSGHIVFSARVDDQTNIWRVPVSLRTGKVSGPAEQLTFGAGREDYPYVSADGSLAFSVLTQKADLMSLAIHSDLGAVVGEAQKLTSDAAHCMRPAVTPDGRRIAFLSNRNGNYDVWTKDLATGKESAITITREDESAVVISPDGTHVAVGRYQDSKWSIFVLPFEGGKPVSRCSDCAEPRAFMPSGSDILQQRLSATGESLIERVDAAGVVASVLRSSGFHVFSPSVSADGKWIAAVTRKVPNEHRVVAIPLINTEAAPESEWVPVTDSGYWVDKPRWSPNGKTLYYVSDRDGFVCIWANAVDQRTRRPVAEPKAIAHFHQGRNSLSAVYGLDLSVAKDKLIFNLGEESGNIWLTPARK